MPNVHSKDMGPKDVTFGPKKAPLRKMEKGEDRITYFESEIDFCRTIAEVDDTNGPFAVWVIKTAFKQAYPDEVAKSTKLTPRFWGRPMGPLPMIDNPDVAWPDNEPIDYQHPQVLDYSHADDGKLLHVVKRFYSEYSDHKAKGQEFLVWLLTECEPLDRVKEYMTYWLQKKSNVDEDADIDALRVTAIAGEEKWDTAVRFKSRFDSAVDQGLEIADILAIKALKRAMKLSTDDIQMMKIQKNFDFAKAGMDVEHSWTRFWTIIENWYGPAQENDDEHTRAMKLKNRRGPTAAAGKKVDPAAAFQYDESGDAVMTALLATGKLVNGKWQFHKQGQKGKGKKGQGKGAKKECNRGGNCSFLNHADGNKCKFSHTQTQIDAANRQRNKNAGNPSAFKASAEDTDALMQMLKAFKATQNKKG